MESVQLFPEGRLFNALKDWWFSVSVLLWTYLWRQMGVLGWSCQHPGKLDAQDQQFPWTKKSFFLFKKKSRQ